MATVYAETERGSIAFLRVMRGIAAIHAAFTRRRGSILRSKRAWTLMALHQVVIVDELGFALFAFGCFVGFVRVVRGEGVVFGIAAGIL